MSKACFFTIVSNNYRHFARTLVRSVGRYSPGIDAVVVICDDPLPAADPRDGYREISIRELGLPKFDRFVFQYTILELNTAIKPWAIQALFDRGYERVVYLDPDIKLYGAIDAILARLDGADIVLTPHLTGPLDDGRHPSELNILQSGSYNLGFIALRKSEESRRFVTWWQGKLLRDCVVDIPRGLFTDQKWIDLVPGMYRAVAIERDPGWNVAYWNLNHRHVVQDDGSFSVDGRPLLFFHFSGFAPGGRLLSKHQDRFTMEDVAPAVRALAIDYANDLHDSGAEECRRVPYAFGRFPSGEPIPDMVRRCYRESFPWDAAAPRSVDQGRGAVPDRLAQPAGPGAPSLAVAHAPRRDALPATSGRASGISRRNGGPRQELRPLVCRECQSAGRLRRDLYRAGTGGPWNEGGTEGRDAPGQRRITSVRPPARRANRPAAEVTAPGHVRNPRGASFRWRTGWPGASGMPSSR